MNASQLNLFLTQEAFKGVSIEMPGKIYSVLCQMFPLQRIKTKKNHSMGLNVLTKLSELLHEVKMQPTDKKQILNYMDALGLLVEEYEKRHFMVNLNTISGVEVLEFLMQQHLLKQSDLADELGGQSIVSEILSGKRKLNSQQILALSKRFGVSPSVFFP